VTEAGSVLANLPGDWHVFGTHTPSKSESLTRLSLFNAAACHAFGWAKPRITNACHLRACFRPIEKCLHPVWPGEPGSRTQKSGQRICQIPKISHGQSVCLHTFHSEIRHWISSCQYTNHPRGIAVRAPERVEYHLGRGPGAFINTRACTHSKTRSP
jgi:hypothetical protein